MFLAVVESQEVGEGVSFFLICVLGTLSLSTHLFPMDIFGEPELHPGPCYHPASRRDTGRRVQTLPSPSWDYLHLHWILLLNSGPCPESPNNRAGMALPQPHQTCVHPGPAVLSPCDCQLCLSRDGSSIFCPLVVTSFSQGVPSWSPFYEPHLAHQQIFVRWIQALYKLV